MLGAVPGSVNAGEVNALFSRVATQDQRCGCGEPFSACPFWTAVGENAFGGWSTVTGRMSDLQPRVVRQRYVPQMVTGLAGRRTCATRRVPRRPPPALPGDRCRVRVRRGSGREQVDRPALRAAPHRRPRPAGSQPGPRLARRRQLVEQDRHPQAPVDRRGPDGDLLPAPAGHAVGRTAAGVRRLVGGCAARRPSPLRGPRRASAADARARPAGRRSGAGARSPGARRENSVTLDRSHGVAGSRTRFTEGRIELQLDDAWRSALPVTARRVVTA